MCKPAYLVKRMNTRSLVSLVIPTVVAVMLAACSTPQPEGVQQMREEMYDRRLKRVTAGAAQEFSQKFGSTLADSIDAAFTAEIERGTASTSCQPVFAKVSAYMAKEMKATVLRLPFWKTDTAALPDHKLADLYSAYQYSHANAQPLEANVQKLSDTAFWVTKPITLNSTKCLSCHNELNQKPLKVGNALGIYAIRISKAEVIKHIDIKELKARTAANKPNE